jgi:AAA domain-containing protein/TIR domain-containing protein
MRFFISYRRRAEADQGLANYLLEGLKAAGHDVFIDVEMAIGTDWAKEIAQRIDWCDYFIVLLSDQSVKSEMVQGEIRRAHHRRRPDGCPCILPIRVRFDDPLDYELDSYLSRLQYLLWREPGDSETVLTSIRDLAKQGDSKLTDGLEFTTTALPPNPTAPPRVSVDPRFRRRQPGGGIEASDPFYIRRGADDRVAEIADSPMGETLVIKGPRQMGKTSLLNAYIDECLKKRKRCIFIDFQSYTNSDLDNYIALLGRLAVDFLRCLEIGDDLRVPTFASQQDFRFFVEDRIVRPVGGPLVFAFDEVDRVLGRYYQQDFFSLLRVWHNYRSKPSSVWRQVDLALVISTEPYLLIDTPDSSPFNVAISLELGPFLRGDLDVLNSQYGSDLSVLELDSLFDLLGGHPYLTRLALYRLVVDKMLFSQLLEDAAEPDGPFGEHLRSMLLRLQEHGTSLLTSLRQAIVSKPGPNEEAYFRLRGAGLVRRHDGRVVPSNLLYARFFKTVT